MHVPGVPPGVRARVRVTGATQRERSRSRKAATAPRKACGASAWTQWPDPDAERHRRLRDRFLLLLLVLVFVSGTAAALFGERGYFDLRRTHLEEQDLQRQVNEQLDRVRELKSEVRDLNDDPTAIERIAREDLGYIREGEIHFLLPREDPGWDIRPGQP